MSDSLSEEAIRQLHFRYKLTADAAKSYFEDGFSVVIQDNYYGNELNRMLSYLHTYPAEAIVLCPNQRKRAAPRKNRVCRFYS